MLFQHSSIAEQAVISLTKCGIFQLKCTKMRLAARLCQTRWGNIEVSQAALQPMEMAGGSG